MTTPAPSFTPGPSFFYDNPAPSPFTHRWQVVVRRENHGEAIVSAWGDSAEDATKRAHIASAADALYAYAKACDLYNKMLDEMLHNYDSNALLLRAELLHMGWTGSHDDFPEWAEALRAAALAQAEGRNT